MKHINLNQRIKVVKINSKTTWRFYKRFNFSAPSCRVVRVLNEKFFVYINIFVQTFEGATVGFYGIVYLFKISQEHDIS